MNYPNIYERETLRTQKDIPAHDGIGTLSDAISCIVTRTADGLYELNMTYPGKGRYAEHLLPENLIRADLRRLVHRAEPYLQFFRIVSVEYSLTAKGRLLSVHAEHLSSDLKWAWCKPVNLITRRPSDCVNHIRSQGLNQVDTFTYEDYLAVSDGDYKEFKHEKPFTKLEGLMEVAALFDGCMEPDNRTIRLFPNVQGSSEIVLPEWDLLEMEITRDSSEIVEAVYVYFKDSELYTAPRTVMPYDSACGVTHYVAYNFAEESDSPPINDGAAQAIGETWLKYHTQQGERVTYSAKLADTGKKDFSLLDKVVVYDPWHKIDVKLQVRKIVFDVLRAKYETIEVGDLSRDITDTVAGLVTAPSGIPQAVPEEWRPTDYILESGSSGIWEYRKYASGGLEISGKVPVSNLAISTVFGSMYRSQNAYTAANYPYPLAFSNPPEFTANFVTTNGLSALVWVNPGTEQAAKTAPHPVYLVRPTSATGCTGYVSIHASGRWK